MSYIVSKDDCSLSDRKQFMQRAEAAGIARYHELVGRSTDELVSRQALNIVDFGAAVEQWRTAALAAVGTNYSVFQAAAPVTLANTKLLVVYGISIETTPVPVSRLVMRMGSATGNVKAEYDLEQIINSDTLQGYFNQAVVFDPQAIFDIQVTCRIATGVFARIQLMNFLIEPVGPLVA